MTRPGSARAPKGASGTCRPSRRQRARGPAWVRPYRQAQRALDKAAKLLLSTIQVVMDVERCGARLPVRTAQRLNVAVRGMTVASRLVIDARRELAEATEALGRDPEQQKGDVPEIIELAEERCRKVAESIPIVVQELALAQFEILGGLSLGELVPERSSDARPRIVTTPRPLFVRAFLASRLPRISDRITPALLRRRRTPRPAEVRVPRPNLQGRAPPLSSTCAL